MAFVVLTRRNLAAIKSSLLKAFPGLRSGHADEAIAAGLGFRSYAALTASLKVQGTARPIVVLREAVLGKRMSELAGIAPEGDRWIEVWKMPLPDRTDVFNLADWWQSPANQN